MYWTFWQKHEMKYKLQLFGNAGVNTVSLVPAGVGKAYKRVKQKSSSCIFCSKRTGLQLGNIHGAKNL